MSTYYVSSSGSNSNSGTSPTTPWLTIAYALSNSSAGDTINLNGGNTFSENPSLTSGRTIQSYGTGLATIAGGNSNHTFTTTNCGGITLTNLNLTNTDTTSGYSVVEVIVNNGATYSGVTVNGCTLSGGYRGFVVRVTTVNTGTLNNVLIENNLITGPIQFGVWMASTEVGSGFSFSNVNIANNTIENIPGNTSGHVGTGVELQACHSSVGVCYIQNNYLYNIGSNSAGSGTNGGPGAAFFYYSDGGIIRNNVCNLIYASTDTKLDGVGVDIDLGNTNGQLLDNVCINCQGAGCQIIPSAGSGTNVCAGNLVVNCATTNQAGILAHSADPCNIYNNTVIQQAGTNPAMSIDTQANTAHKGIYNNIFITPSGTTSVSFPTSTTGFSLQGNAYLSGTGFNATYNGVASTSLAAWRTATGQETSPHGIALTSNPCLDPSPVPAIVPSNLGLAFAYALKAGSSLLGAGLNLTSLYSITIPSTDLVGEPITSSALSVGAINNALSYTLVGPTTGLKGMASTNFTLTPSAAVSDTITLSDGGLGGVFSPTSITFTSSQGAATFTYTPATLGSATLTLTSGLGAAISGSPASYLATPAYQWKYVNGNCNQGGVVKTQSTTLSSVTAGDLILAAVTLGNSESTTVTDNKGNSYTQANVYGNTSLWYAKATTGGSITVTATVATATEITIAIGEYSVPPGSTISVEHTESGTGAGTAVSITSIPVTKPDLVAMAINLANSPGASTAGSAFVKRQNPPGGGGNPGILFQDCLNPLSSPVTSTATLANYAYWTAVSGAFLASMPTYELVGPTTVANGFPATFDLVPSGTVASDTITLSDGGFGGAFSPTSLSFSSSPFAHSFTYTPSKAGFATLTLASSQGYTIGAAPWSLGSFVNYTLNGPTTGLVGVPSTFTLTPVATTTDTISFSDGGMGGTFSPTSLSLSNSSAPQTFSYSPGEAGTATITVTSAVGATITGSPASVAAVAVVVSAYVVKSGKLAMFGVASSSGESNGAYPLASVTAVNSNPTIKVNGNTVSIGPPTWYDHDKSLPIVAFLLECGSLQTLTVSSGGANYSTPAAVWNNDGGGTGLTVGTPVLAAGVTSYTIASAGSGMANGTYLWAVPGGSQAGWVTGANAYVTVAGNAVTSVVPMCGSVQGYGSSYPGSSFSSSFSGAGGTAATITCHVSKYIQSIPVTAGGSGFTSPPSFTITDSTGSGCVAAPIMTGPLATDVLTYSAAAGWLTTSLGTMFAATNAPMTNWIGQNEGPTGNLNGFTAQPTMLFGVEHPDQSTFYQVSNICTQKNKLKNASKWHMGAYCYALSCDATFTPTTWTPGGTIYCYFYGASANGTGAFYSGNWTVQYDDSLAGQSGASTVTLSDGSGTTVISLVSTTTVGTTVTQVWSITLSPGYHGDYCVIQFNITSNGRYNLSNPWVFAPNNTISRSNAFAVDDNAVADLTGPNGSVPAVFRFMDSVNADGGTSNYVEASDIASTNLFSWFVPYCLDYVPSGVPGTTYPSGQGEFQYARFYNTNSASSTYTWYTNRLYSTAVWACSGTDSFGQYLDLTQGPLGPNDNGSYLGLGYNQAQYGVLELRSTSAHGLKTGQLIFMAGTGTIPFTSYGNFTFSTAGNYAVYVTGAYTVAILVGFNTHTAGSSCQTVNSTTEIPVVLTWSMVAPASAAIVPYEYAASFVSRFPGAALWLNLSNIGDDSYVTAVANKIISQIGPTNHVILERGNEHWNSATNFYQYFNELQETNLTAYMPVGTKLFGYYTTNGTALVPGTADAWYTIKSAHQFDVFQAAWIAAGLNPGNIKRCYGSNWGEPSTTSNIANTITSYKVPADYIAIAPYQGFADYIEPSMVAAYSPAGYPGHSNGNWPVDAINDFARHAIFYNQLTWDYWSSHAAAMPSGVKLVCYESGIDYLIPAGVPNTSWLAEDCLYHPSYYDLIHGLLLAYQQGNPTVAGSGAYLASYYMLWRDTPLGGALWRLGTSPAQPIGRGMSNQYLTPQGGPGATGSWPVGYAQTNQAPGIQALKDWNSL